MGNAAAYEALARMRKSLAQMSRVPSRAAKGASTRIARLVRAQFAAGVDPYGRPWAPHAESTIRRWGTHPIEVLTGALVRGIKIRPARGAGIQVTMSAPYAAFQQIGTANMPARTLLPDSRGLPDTWRRAIADASEKAFDEAIR